MEFNSIIYLNNKEELTSAVIGELKNYGIKYNRCSRKTKGTQNKSTGIFQRNLEVLPLVEVVLTNGSHVKVPRFLHEACSFIKENDGVEGIFRKAGSNVRQKKIRDSLETGMRLGDSHHVVDVANVVKYFLRSLPEPLISANVQQTLKQCITTNKNDVRPIVLTCLLMSRIALDTLAYFMQFLHQISLNECQNKMSAKNLAIVLAPGLMSLESRANVCPSKNTFDNHVEIIRLLIENADSIGKMPACILKKISQSSSAAHGSQNSVLKPIGSAESKKKRKRRSDIFVGLKKFVGTTLGTSLEDLDNSFNGNVVDPDKIENANLELFSKNMTPSRNKSSKKLKALYLNSNNSAKKKTELMSLPETDSNGIWFNPNLPKESKKSRLSFGGHRFMKSKSSNSNTSKLERRWSINEPSSSKAKSAKVMEELRDVLDGIECEENQLKETDFANASVICEEVSEENPLPVDAVDSERAIDLIGEMNRIVANKEYTEIEERVTALEKRMSHEIKEIRRSLSTSEIDFKMNGPDRVASKFKRVVKETASLNSPGATQLTDCLNRHLHINKRSHSICRSPSARKIGTIRGRSHKRTPIRQKVKVHVNQEEIPTSNIGFQSETSVAKHKSNGRHVEFAAPTPKVNKNPFTGDSNLKPSFDGFCTKENWTPGEIFFDHTNCDDNNKFGITPNEFTPKTPLKPQSSSLMEPPSSVCTPMLPPRSISRRMLRTPNQSAKSFTRDLTNRPTPLSEQGNERDSIAFIRNNKLGNVVAKAKLFEANTDCLEYKQTPYRPLHMENRLRKRTPSAETFLTKCSFANSNNQDDLPKKQRLFALNNNDIIE